MLGSHSPGLSHLPWRQTCTPLSYFLFRFDHGVVALDSYTSVATILLQLSTLLQPTGPSHGTMPNKCPTPPKTQSRRMLFLEQPSTDLSRYANELGFVALLHIALLAPDRIGGASARDLMEAIHAQSVPYYEVHGGANGDRTDVELHMTRQQSEAYERLRHANAHHIAAKIKQGGVTFEEEIEDRRDVLHGAKENPSAGVQVRVCSSFSRPYKSDRFLCVKPERETWRNWIDRCRLSILTANARQKG